MHGMHTPNCHRKTLNLQLASWFETLNGNQTEIFEKYCISFTKIQKQTEHNIIIYKKKYK